MTIFENAKKLLSSLDPLGFIPLKINNPHPELKIVFLGAGVVGGSVGAWVAQNYNHAYFLDQGEVAKALKAKGITTYLGAKPGEKTNVQVNMINKLEEAADADVVVIGVKNYSLEAVAKMVRKKMGDRPIIVAMQNGLDNQRILPKYFSKVIYCVVSYNAWIDESGHIGYQKKGPLHFGTLQNELMTEMEDITAIFNLGVETHITHQIADAAHCKLVINLTNSLTTLIGMGFRPISDSALFQKLLTNLTWEGVQIIKAAGFKEVSLGGMPPWALLWSGAKLPRTMTKRMFERNVKKMVISSMAQDLIQRGGKDSELESINGYILGLAEKHNAPAPYNKAVYELAKREFAKPKFETLDVAEVWEYVKSRF
jgi:2-dehydropantoate 2-reductase